MTIEETTQTSRYFLRLNHTESYRVQTTGNDTVGYTSVCQDEGGETVAIWADQITEHRISTVWMDANVHRIACRQLEKAMYYSWNPLGNKKNWKTGGETVNGRITCPHWRPNGV